MKRKNNLEIFCNIFCYFCFIFILTSFFSKLNADNLVFVFKNPAFSGIGYSAHVLTVDEQERTRKAKIAEDIESAIDEALREAENTTLSKFVRNLESRVFSRLSQDLAESLFDDSGGSGGSIDLEGNTINFINTGTEIVLTILDIDGVTTEIRIPIGSFGICADEPCVP